MQAKHSSPSPSLFVLVFCRASFFFVVHVVYLQASWLCTRLTGCAIYISLQHGSPAFDEQPHSLNSTPSRQQGSRSGSSFVPSTPERAAYIASRRISVDYLADAGSHSSAQVPACSCAACCQVICCLPTHSFLDSLPQQVSTPPKC